MQNEFAIDANVMLLAGTHTADIPEKQLRCALRCIEFIDDFIKKQYIVVVLESEKFA